MIKMVKQATKNTLKTNEKREHSNYVRQTNRTARRNR